MPRLPSSMRSGLHISAIVLGALSVLACGKAPPAGAPSSETAPASRNVSSCKATEYPIVTTKGCPYVDLELHSSVASRHGFFLLDTGANTSALDKDWSQGLATPGSGETVLVEKFTFVYEQENVTFHAQDLKVFDQIRGEPQIGTLGTDYLSEFAIDFDFAKSVVRLIRHDDAEPCGPDWARMRRAGLTNYSDQPPTAGPPNIPTVELTIGAQHLPCQLDTGTNVSSAETWIAINSAAFSALEPEFVRVREDTFQQTGRSVKAGVYQRKDGKPIVVSIGGGQVAIDVLKVEGPEAGMPFNAPTPYALAGMPLMSKWTRIVFDSFSRQLAYQ